MLYLRRMRHGIGFTDSFKVVRWSCEVFLYSTPLVFYPGILVSVHEGLSIFFCLFFFPSKNYGVSMADNDRTKDVFPSLSIS